MDVAEQPVAEHRADAGFRFFFEQSNSAGMASRTASHRGGT